MQFERHIIMIIMYQSVTA